MLQTHLDAAPTTLNLIDAIEFLGALSVLAFLDFAVGFPTLLRLVAFTWVNVLIPLQVVVGAFVGLDSWWAERAEHDVLVACVELLHTVVLGLGSVLATVLLVTFLAFERQEILLFAELEAAERTNFTKFHKLNFKLSSNGKFKVVHEKFVGNYKKRGWAYCCLLRLRLPI